MLSKNFLDCFPGYVIQTFDDSGENQKMARCGKPESFKSGELEALNRAGAGIFFSVNSFPGGVRKQALCAGINAWFAECDTLSKEKQWELLEGGVLQPHIVVGSKRSLQMYWLADKTATIENFKRIQLGLAKRFQGDVTMKDIARVLRLPGYYHMKHKHEPYMVGIHQDFTSIEDPYSEAEMLAEFPYEEIRKPELFESVERPAVPIEKMPLTSDTFWELASHLNNMMMLQRLSGSAFVNGEEFTFRERSGGGYYILVDGRTCNAWLDKDGMIGSGSGGGPTWIQWLRWYGVGYDDIARWLKALVRSL